jgi:hypothetical protein
MARSMPALICMWTSRPSRSARTVAAKAGFPNRTNGTEPGDVRFRTMDRPITWGRRRNCRIPVSPDRQLMHCVSLTGLAVR